MCHNAFIHCITQGITWHQLLLLIFVSFVVKLLQSCMNLVHMVIYKQMKSEKFSFNERIHPIKNIWKFYHVMVAKIVKALTLHCENFSQPYFLWTYESKHSKKIIVILQHWNYSVFGFVVTYGLYSHSSMKIEISECFHFRWYVY